MKGQTTTADRPGHPVARCIEYFCWLAGALALAYVLLISLGTVIFQAEQSKRLDHLQKNELQVTARQSGDLFGRITIPRLGLSAVIEEGVDQRTLRHAVGHFPGSSVPEKAGTVALAGHRDTFFRALAHVRVHDLILLQTLHGKYEYRVVRTAVVAPQHVEVVQSSPQSDLTLVTCYPFHYVGPAPLRFIVQALRLPAQKHHQSEPTYRADANHPDLVDAVLNSMSRE